MSQEKVEVVRRTLDEAYAFLRVSYQERPVAS
jgi:hypothetical protein